MHPRDKETKRQWEREREKERLYLIVIVSSAIGPYIHTEANARKEKLPHTCKLRHLIDLDIIWTRREQWVLSLWGTDSLPRTSVVHFCLCCVNFTNRQPFYHQWRCSLVSNGHPCGPPTRMLCLGWCPLTFDDNGQTDVEREHHSITSSNKTSLRTHEMKLSHLSKAYIVITIIRWHLLCICVNFPSVRILNLRRRPEIWSVVFLFVRIFFSLSLSLWFLFALDWKRQGKVWRSQRRCI